MKTLSLPMAAAVLGLLLQRTALARHVRPLVLAAVPSDAVRAWQQQFDWVQRMNGVHLEARTPYRDFTRYYVIRDGQRFGEIELVTHAGDAGTMAELDFRIKENGIRRGGRDTPDILVTRDAWNRMAEAGRVLTWDQGRPGIPVVRKDGNPGFANLDSDRGPRTIAADIDVAPNGGLSITGYSEGREGGDSTEQKYVVDDKGQVFEQQ